MRDPARPFRVWADALCINQADHAEKMRQVAMMGRIYASASHTVIHLGSLTPDADAVFSHALGGASTPQQHTDDILAVALRDLLLRPWFRRVWIFQELLLSQDPWVQCSASRVRWAALCGVLVPSGKLPMVDGAPLGSSLRNLQEMNAARAGRSVQSLFNILLARRGFGAADPRDLVYAQLGILSDRDAVMAYVTLDYGMPVARLYAQVAWYVMETQNVGVDKGMDVLVANLEHEAGQPRLRDLPSWAPDWRYKALAKPLTYGALISGNYNTQGTYRVLDLDSMVLGYVGHRADTIHTTSAVLPALADIPPETLAEHARISKQIHGVYAARGGVYYTGGSDGVRAHVSLRGVEEQHRLLCREIADQWRNILTSSSPSSHTEESSQALFMENLERWFDDGAEAHRIFLHHDSHGLAKLMNEHFLPRAVHSLAGKRLAHTQGGRVGVVPAQAQPGDVLLSLPSCQALVVARPLPARNTTTLASGGVEGVVLEKLRAAGGEVRLWDDKRTAVWRVEEAVGVEAFEVVGLGFLDEYAPWKDGMDKLEAFALY
ncbi:heterokaryon incompatibility protein-domain-containing protein [Stachybotrys elegans]|uniref:Heterokaryon incompatibility protein-domain-containing protein n=1 Tax=Stachybotrys elegans TaxID=80388 RepID=A0A8K0WUP4_9HYPO|nr:heterokaryon incompatibility protein-domain-containing protein [Stachybotrys elegans]